MAEDHSGDGFDLDHLIAARLGDQPGGETELQALAVLIDADLTDAERMRAFGTLIASVLAETTTDQREHFQQITDQQGPAAALAYLSTVSYTQ
jgi:hypothetical protein